VENHKTTFASKPFKTHFLEPRNELSVVLNVLGRRQSREPFRRREGERRLRILQVIGFDEGQPITVEHAADIYEKDAFNRTAEEDFLIEEFAQTPPVCALGKVGQPILCHH
jgi:hypothetical protein